jgi:hypothetical protein
VTASADASGAVGLVCAVAGSGAPAPRHGGCLHLRVRRQRLGLPGRRCARTRSAHQAGRLPLPRRRLLPPYPRRAPAGTDPGHVRPAARRRHADHPRGAHRVPCQRADPARRRLGLRHVLLPQPPDQPQPQRPRPAGDARLRRHRSRRNPPRTAVRGRGRGETRGHPPRHRRKPVRHSFPADLGFPPPGARRFRVPYPLQPGARPLAGQMVRRGCRARPRPGPGTCRHTSLRSGGPPACRRTSMWPSTRPRRRCCRRASPPHSRGWMGAASCSNSRNMLRSPTIRASLRRSRPFAPRDFRLAIDDAGAGYSGLQHILRLKPDIIKLDMALTRDVDTDPRPPGAGCGTHPLRPRDGLPDPRRGDRDGSGIRDVEAPRRRQGPGLSPRPADGAGGRPGALCPGRAGGLRHIGLTAARRPSHRRRTPVRRAGSRRCSARRRGPSPAGSPAGASPTFSV